MRVAAINDAVYTYPDISALCGRPQFRDDRRDTLLNPTVMVEVLSLSTELYDRNRKFGFYQRMESLQEYVLISQDTMRVELFTRGEGDQWESEEYTQPDDEVPLQSVGAVLSAEGLFRLAGPFRAM